MSVPRLDSRRSSVQLPETSALDGLDATALVAEKAGADVGHIILTSATRGTEVGTTVAAHVDTATILSARFHRIVRLASGQLAAEFLPRDLELPRLVLDEPDLYAAAIFAPAQNEELEAAIQAMARMRRQLNRVPSITPAPPNRKEHHTMSILVRDMHPSFTPAPEGVHQAVCVDVIDCGVVPTNFGNKHKVDLRFESSPDGQGTRPFLVRKRYTLSLHEKASLRHDLETWRGRKFSPAELDGFDLEKLIGVNCQVSIIHTVNTHGRTYADIIAILPLPKGLAKISPSREYVRAKDRPANGAPTDTDDGEGGASDDDIPF